MLNTEEAKKFRKARHRVLPAVTGHVDTTGIHVSGIAQGEQQERIMSTMKEDPLYGYISGTGYDSRSFPTDTPPDAA